MVGSIFKFCQNKKSAAVCQLNLIMHLPCFWLNGAFARVLIHSYHLEACHTQPAISRNHLVNNL